MENTRVMIVRDIGKTRLWIADQPGVFKGYPNFVWERELSDAECAELLEDPWCCMYKKSEPLRPSAELGPADKALREWDELQEYSPFQTETITIIVNTLFHGLMIAACVKYLFWG